MKKILTILFVCSLSLTAYAQKANIEFEKTTIDLGQFGSDNVIQKCHFVFKNTGDADLYIHQILTSCGCTSKEYPTYAIKPNATDTIFVTYNGPRSSGQASPFTATPRRR